MESKTELELFLHQTPKSDLEHPFLIHSALIIIVN